MMHRGDAVPKGMLREERREKKIALASSPGLLNLYVGHFYLIRTYNLAVYGSIPIQLHYSPFEEGITTWRFQVLFRLGYTLLLMLIIDTQDNIWDHGL